jgi:hypothetical protein
MKRSRFVLSILVVVGMVAVARAQSNSSVEARRHYEAGNTAYSLGEFVRAAEEYKAAYKARQDPAFLYNIAQAFRLANDPANAVFFYRSFLHNQANASNRREVEDRIAKLEAQLAAREATTTPPNSVIAPATGNRATVEPTITESKPPAAPEASKPAEPAKFSAPAEVTTPAPELVVANAPATKPAASATPVYKKWWLWTVVGVVVAGAAAGTAAGILLSKGSGPDSHFGTVSVYQ